MTTYTVTIEVDEEGELVLPILDNVLNDLGWKAGDIVSWEPNWDGSFTVTKVPLKTEWVMVESVTSYRNRYLVEVPAGKAANAIEIVHLDEAKCFSRQHLREHIVSHHVITKEGAMDLCRKDNAHKSKWSDAEFEKVYFTEMKDD